VRINNYQLAADWTGYIGTKTTVFATNLYRKEVKKTWPDLLHDGVEEVWPTIPRSNAMRTWKRDWAFAQHAFGDQLDTGPSLREFVTLASDLTEQQTRWMLFLLKHFGYAGYLLMRNWLVSPSSGLMAIYLAMCTEPRELLITGFDFFSQPTAHYFSEAPPPDSRRHQFAREPEILAELFRKHPDIQIAIAIQKSLFEEHFSGIDNVDRLAAADSS
jgi:hypothetical protein